MDFNYFDLIAAIIILLLGLKGILNGFFKELFGLIGIIGGIFVASRNGNEVGQYLSDMIFKFQNESAINFTGFLATLAIFWLFMVSIGYIFKKLSSMSGLGPIDRIFGFIFGASKFFLIAAVIAHAAYSVKAVKATVDSSMEKSILFPILVETGGYIMKIDPTEISKDINNTVSESSKKIQDSVTQAVSDKTKQMLEETSKGLKEK
ncbi:MAG: CvpA family protein [Campylobacterales bacterium]|nr:CvpA family protein [Campylobacterales bacterium]